MKTNIIYNGDCVQGMTSLSDESVQLLLTDPPYLVNYTDRTGRSIQNDGLNSGEWLEPAFKETYRVLAKNTYAVVFFGWNEAEKFIIAWKKAGFRIVGNFTFNKNYASNQHKDKKHMLYQHESACLLAKGYPQPNEIIGSTQGWKYTGNEIHPTQKPIPQLLNLVNAFSKAGDVVLDPFMGSGSTAEACIRSGRQFVGYELDSKYYNLSTQRLNNLNLEQTTGATNPQEVKEEIPVFEYKNQ